MAGRPPKQSIDFAGWNVNIFDCDRKIDKLLDAQGCTGFVIYFFLCQRAYGSNGYYYSWCYDDAATTAKKIGGGAGAQSVEETVRFCLQTGLFDNRLFDRWKILTSRGIQKRYMQVALTRTYKSVISEYWLLSREESAGLSFHSIEMNFSPENSNYEGSKLNYAPIKESKVKNSTVQDTTVDSPREGEAPAADPPSAPPAAVPYHEIMDLYNSVCKSFLQIRAITGIRKKAVCERFNFYGSIQIFKDLFQKVEASDFLKGQNKRNWVADFDWLMDAENMNKTLEGKYDNRAKSTKQQSSGTYEATYDPEEIEALLDKEYFTE